MYWTVLFCILPIITGIPVGDKTQQPYQYYWGGGDGLIPYQIDETEEDGVNEAKASDVYFNLFNKTHMDIGIGIQILDTGISLVDTFARNEKFNNSLYAIIHGFTENGNKQWLHRMKKDILTADPTSFVVIVDWGKLSSAPWYVSSARNSYFTGDLLHDIIMHFHVHHEVSLDKVHLIGFSLGAHVAAVAGHKIGAYGKKIGRITGLDPAYPLFGNDNLQKRLDPTDAEFVDVIHTNAAYVLTNGVGYPEDVGHVDFWPNGGKSQPGCGLRADPIDMMSACSHSRSHEYFRESILNGDGLGAVKCDSWKKYKKGKCSENEKVTFGMFVNKKSRGTFFLETNGAPPFAKNKF